MFHIFNSTNNNIVVTSESILLFLFVNKQQHCAIFIA